MASRKRPRLPPFSALRAFEAAARHGSMSGAARELSLTQGAVSRQISLLQSRLNIRLIVRRGRGIALTELGQRLFHGVHAGLDRLRLTLEEITGDADERIVTITTLPTIAARWLLPRIGAFHEQHPDITLDVRSSLALEDLAEASFDLAIRYGEGRWSGVASQLLFTAVNFPVCSPGFVQKCGALRKPLDLLDVPLIHTVSRQWWVDWLHAAGVESAKLRGGIIVDEYGLAIQLAVDGHGVALGRDALIGRELGSGALIRLFETVVTPRYAYYLCRAALKPMSKPVREVMDWLIEQSQNAGSQAAGLVR